MPCSFVTKRTKSSGVPIPRTPKRPRRGEDIIGRGIIYTKQVLLFPILSFYTVGLIRHSCLRQRPKNRLPAAENDANGFSANKHKT